MPTSETRTTTMPATVAVEPAAGGLESSAAGGLESPAPLPRSLLPETASLRQDGRLELGGVDVLDLCAAVGTPVFVYDEEHLRRRCAEARAAWGDTAAYASKAFLCKAIAALVHAEGLRIDVSTGGELHVALAAGVPAERLVLHGNNKSVDELRTALDAGVGRIVVDSFDELDRLEVLAAGRDRRPKVLLRVTPGIEAHTHEYVRTGQDDSKFGFGLRAGAAQQAVERLRRARCPLELVGIHAHIGSQIFALESFAKAIRVLAPFFAGLDLTELCVGGGVGVAYVTGEATPSLTAWAATVRQAARQAGLDDRVVLSAEPGRAIVAAAAITCYTVGTIKVIPGARTYVSVDGGMSDNPRPVLYGSGYEAFLPRATNAPRPRSVTVVGKHCESGDIVVRDAQLPSSVAVGDILATPVTGAYGYSMASNYNKVPRPAVVFVADGSWRTVIRRETYQDLLALEP